MRLLLVAMMFVMSGCACFAFALQFDKCNAYQSVKYEMSNYTNYQIGKLVKTPGGIAVDTSGFDIDLKMIDQIVTEREKCIGKSIVRCGFRVKIAPDWKIVEGQQVFPCKIPSPGHGIPGADLCYGIVQYPNTATTTPNLSTLAHEVTHIVTGIEDHNDPIFKKCP